MIEIQNLTKSYRVQSGRHYVFQNVSAVFPTGANIGIIGPNGGGKSTLLRILGGIDHPDSGRIISDRSFSWPMALKGGFVSHMSGRENCRMVCNLYGLDPNDTKKKLEKMKELTGIGKYFEEPVKYYSSGMSGRLGFALSMAFDFDYFLIDEITSVGDAHFKEMAKEAFTEKIKRSNMIMVSHNMGDIKKFCDIAVLVKNGQMVVFEDMDEAIRAYLPQTQEAREEAVEITRHVNLAETDITEVQLSPSQAKTVSDIASRLESVEMKLGESRHQILGNHGDFYFSLGSIYQILGNDKIALDYYNKAVATNGYNLKAQQKLAELAAATGNYEEEQKAIAAAESIDPLNVRTLKAKLQSLLRSHDFNAALPVSDTALQAAPLDSALWSQRSQILLGLGDIASALQAQIKAVKNSPKSSRYYHQLAAVLATSGDLPSSLLARQQAFVLEENSIRVSRPPTYNHILRILVRIDDTVRV